MAYEGELIGGVRVPRWRPDDGHGNFGDEIGPVIVRALAPTEPSATVEEARRLISVGSVLHFAQPGDVIWGAGVNGKVRQKLARDLDVRSVRGPLTRAVLLAHGVRVPAVYGDPALLLPGVLPEVRREPSGEVLVVPNLNEMRAYEEGNVLSPLGDVREIVQRIVNAEFVVATSLHALIVADAFGVPSRPLVPRAEHPFKYVDYYAGTGRYGVRFARSVQEAHDLGPVDAPNWDPLALQRAFPQDLWASEWVPRAVPEDSFLRMLAQSRTQLDRLAIDLGPDVTDQEALALVRAQQIIADQLVDEQDMVDALRRRDAVEVAEALERYLAVAEPREALDRELVGQLTSLRGSSPDEDLPELTAAAYRLTSRGNVLLARAVVRGEADIQAAYQWLESSAPAQPN